jgi:hypothetical protein
MTGRADKSIVVPAEAIARLKDGNSRYTIERPAELAKGQHPFAIVVSCSDSRVSPEIVFDQALGDLFICRVAGNVINDESLGSIEYAVDELGVRLDCGPGASGLRRGSNRKGNYRCERQSGWAYPIPCYGN